MHRNFRFLTGLVAAPHTPMTKEGEIDFSKVPLQAEILMANRVAGAFVCGSTGESHSLTTAERMQLADTWRRAIGSGPLRLIVHTGHNSVEDAKNLSAHAARIRADGISVMAPCYFKPEKIENLLDFCAPVAACAPDLPFYFYDIPGFSGVSLPMEEFLKQGASRIPNLAGLKFSSSDLMSLQQCLEVANGRFNILFGCDEILLSALAFGVHGAVGSTYNYAAPLYHQIIEAFQSGDLERARALQLKSVRLVETLEQYGVLAAGKAIMGLLGVECGPPRPPVRALTDAQITALHQKVSSMGILADPVPSAIPR